MHQLLTEHIGDALARISGNILQKADFMFSRKIQPPGWVLSLGACCLWINKLIFFLSEYNYEITIFY